MDASSLPKFPPLSGFPKRLLITIDFDLLPWYKQLESDCITTFEWHTNITCLNQTNVGTRFSFDVGRNIRKTPTRIGLVASIVITLFMFLLASWYCVKPNKRRYFLHSCFNFFKSRRNGRVQYHRIGTNEQARLLLDANNDPTQCQSDSDDDLLDA
uniref:Uncharacterized protein n=1 Tax=Vespula pensylvanica TaxID=30213 RepID=A0A834PA44_VESPE|nr:hypothetical protein H0235_002513 [Vespula pensylvanica]